MVEIGYKLACEEHEPLDLVCNARQAEDAGFAFAMISDHYHPWTNRQGQSPFVWGVLGGISQVTADLRLVTGVTCPTMRIHPGIIAQAAATAAGMMPGRFILGLGSGENLNEHVFGDRWPPAPVRIEMLEEAVEVIRMLWKGGMQDYYGSFYTLENAQIFSLPEKVPPIYIASEGPISASLAARVGDGFINPGASAEETLVAFRDSGGGDKPSYVEVSVCWAESEEEGQRTAYERWPISANSGELNRLLPTPTHYEQLATMTTPEEVAKHVPAGPDPEAQIRKIEECIKMGFDHVCVHQIGNRQREFMEFYTNEVLPHFAE
ncbi:MULTISPECIES: TIGR03557 family F420-dependent LLM class oxidoreductase [unclassified Methanoculleus]|jgi:G6PDH family F420-dependent oxidoreductase|uniref:TIGR03557 family F420-dependent LLM class oxidoreductase n=1 Tax=Methanoculleus palmolei TaxID=72612 RepID=A0ABD8A7D4_9EURY|nr:TIGR03557 family F420-dependent LLM class oxidoreductase [Methanoculleus sp. UBA377]WOX55444.1 TIGR03557 family F420-dependent LLM class oxidoreductase [Methanoculleus palmolei]